MGWLLSGCLGVPSRPRDGRRHLAPGSVALSSSEDHATLKGAAVLTEAARMNAEARQNAKKRGNHPPGSPTSSEPLNVPIISSATGALTRNIARARGRAKRGNSKSTVLSGGSSHSLNSLQSHSSKEILEKQQSWVTDERSTLDQKDAQDAEARFRALVTDQGGTKVTKAQLQQAFVSWGAPMQNELFEKVFGLFDSDGDGEVSIVEFSVAYCFLSYRGSAKDKAELAFRIFDQDRDELLSQDEFTELVSGLIGNRLRTLFVTDRCRDGFRSFLQRELCDELLHFLERIDFFSSPARRASLTFPRKEADAIFAEYMEVGADRQINISDITREKCRDAIMACGNDPVSYEVFKESADEVTMLLETGPLPRFKHMMRSEKAMATMAWGWLRMAPENGMTLDQLRSWAAANPGLFGFLDEMQNVLQTASMVFKPRFRAHTNEETVPVSPPKKKSIAF